MSATNEQSPAPATGEAPASDQSAMPKVYGRSVFSTSRQKYWGAFLVFLAIMIVNAVIQALLTRPGVIPNLTSPQFLGLALVSYAVLVVSLGLIISCGLQISAGKVSFANAFSGAAKHFWKFVLWTSLWAAVITIGLALYLFPGLILIILLPFVPIAALDGAKNPLKANFQAIGARKGRFVITLIVSLIWLVLLWVGIGLTNWLVTGSWADFFGWLALVFIGAWLVTGWCLLYRSTPVGAGNAGE